MVRLIKKEQLTEDIVKFDLEAPIIAEKARAGQFVIIRTHEEGERIPLTIADNDPGEGIISIVVLRAGRTTCYLMNMAQGDSILDVVGPLGRETEIENFGMIAVVGGGVGIAPILPITKSMKRAGNYVVSIIGAKNSQSLILKEDIASFSDESYVCTDDGSEGFHGFVSDFLSDYIIKSENSKNSKNIDRVIAIGPVLMMRAVSEVTRKHHIKTVVSLNSIMVDGTGMCGACRVEVNKETRFACVDGPEFDGHEVNFELLISRHKMYLKEEKESLDEYLKDHECKLLKHSI
ncbi:MAG: sulfide/dihydroorotate dehydrogenase-like FAD/NAD-binding protein [Actinobacteria bacterium]|nr:sulfide/dihydroorotate dehydrogenase-like FAD/NAD-binding protein [Actinomycetota bacterium]